jgi:hypothetical protein
MRLARVLRERPPHRVVLHVCGRIIIVHVGVGLIFAIMILMASLFYTGLAAKAIRLFSLTPIVITLILGIGRAVWRYRTW